MMRDPSRKYVPAAPIDLSDRRWPQRRLTRPPVWLSTDLRDGNQALFEPMGSATKLRFFQLLCEIGFKQIEVGFPSASQTEFDFVRLLIDGDHIPPDVTISVLTQAREHLVTRTLEAVRGARAVIVHLYNATSPVFRDRVFGLQPEQVVELAVRGVRQIRALSAAQPGTHWTLEYSPETFSATELPFAKRICDAVTAAWGASDADRVILNLPATVEVSMPNVYADQIEWMHRHLERREGVVLSVHPHNDRGCAVAAAELAQLAGAERVEGCLFGNGERTGNVDLVTLALNLYTQGIDPGLDLSRIEQIARTVEECTRLPVHPRHPYAGDLVFTAFSGSHQDAIRKGMAAQRADAPWQVPYLPIDPQDLGRGYDALIRINSQSGKGGVAFLLEQHHGLVLPRRLQVELGGVVQRRADALGTEIDAAQLWQLFQDEYLASRDLRLLSHAVHDGTGAAGTRVEVQLAVAGQPVTLTGEGNGPLDALLHALPLPLTLPLTLLSFEERSLGTGADARALACIELALGGSRSRFGVGIDTHIVTASLRAAIGALDRVLAAADEVERAAALRALRAGTSTAARRSAARSRNTAA